VNHDPRIFQRDQPSAEPCRFILSSQGIWWHRVTIYTITGLKVVPRLIAGSLPQALSSDFPRKRHYHMSEQLHLLPVQVSSWRGILSLTTRDGIQIWAKDVQQKRRETLMLISYRLYVGQARESDITRCLNKKDILREWCLTGSKKCDATIRDLPRKGGHWYPPAVRYSARE
jgi:hypothetical protein